VVVVAGVELLRVDDLVGPGVVVVGRGVVVRVGAGVVGA
jgi:hypothetical protein